MEQRVMLAMGVYQPWASLIALDAKPFEFRSHRRTQGQVGKRIAIQATARRVVMSEVENLVWVLQQRTNVTGLIVDIALPFLQRIQRHEDECPLSSVVCTALLGEPVRDELLAQQLGARMPVNDSDRPQHSNWGWPLTEIQRVEPPAPASGRRGMWPWSDAR